MISFIQRNLLWQQGKGILVATALLILIGILTHPLILAFGIGALLFSFWFFRNPVRVVPQQSDAKTIVCPADGRVVEIIQLQNSDIGPCIRVSIFLSPLDVHVNWIPVFGKVTKISYKPGAFTVAYAPKSSELNERNDILIQTNQGEKILVRQIAGIIARRICCWIEQGSTVDIGQTYGMIRFGSRVDIFVPVQTELAIKQADYVYGVETILGRLP